MHVYDRLNGAEKGALTRSWQAFSNALLAAENIDHALVLHAPGSSREFDASIERLEQASRFHEDVAKRRAAYLWLIRTLWFRATWRQGGPQPEPHLAKRDVKGEDLDQVLWEFHPKNLFQSIEEAEETRPQINPEVTA